MFFFKKQKSVFCGQTVLGVRGREWSAAARRARPRRGHSPLFPSLQEVRPRPAGAAAGGVKQFSVWRAEPASPLEEHNSAGSNSSPSGARSQPARQGARAHRGQTATKGPIPEVQSVASVQSAHAPRAAAGGPAAALLSAAPGPPAARAGKGNKPKRSQARVSGGPIFRYSKRFRSSPLFPSAGASFYLGRSRARMRA